MRTSESRFPQSSESKVAIDSITKFVEAYQTYKKLENQNLNHQIKYTMELWEENQKALDQGCEKHSFIILYLNDGLVMRIDCWNSSDVTSKIGDLNTMINTSFGGKILRNIKLDAATFNNDARTLEKIALNEKPQDQQRINCGKWTGNLFELFVEHYTKTL